MNALDLPPWLRRQALDTLSTDEFLRLEPMLRKQDGHWDWLCNRQREARGLFVPLAHNHDFTAIRPPA